MQQLNYAIVRFAELHILIIYLVIYKLADEIQRD